VAILTSAEYPAIRAALDTELNTTNLPDSIIALDIYSNAADQDVLQLDPLAASRTGEAANRVKRAAIYFCAARLCPAIVRITSLSVQTRDLNYSRPVFDPAERAAELRAMAQAEINEILTPTEAAAERPTMFAVASGTRGR
jgi:hypothetical protein